MTSEEIRTTVERLKTMPCDHTLSNWGVVAGFMDIDAVNGTFATLALRNRLIGLLEQADPDTHMELPMDADGVPIHVGDDLYIYGERRRCTSLTLDMDEWKVITPTSVHTGELNEVHHYHRVTVEDVLCEFINAWLNPMYEGNVVAAYAEKLREVMADE